MKQLVSALLISFLTINFAWAISLQEAKSQGLIGERIDGYLGYVVTPPATDVVVLVKDVNNKRRQSFQATAAENGISVEKVAHRFYQLAVEATQSNHYYQSADGSWVKK